MTADGGRSRVTAALLPRPPRSVNQAACRWWARPDGVRRDVQQDPAQHVSKAQEQHDPKSKSGRDNMLSHHLPHRRLMN